jgi:hypothetical protein
MVRPYGWGPTSERLVGATPWGHWKTTTFVAGLRASGLVAPMAVDGAMDGPAFRAYVEQVLVPDLRKGDVVWREFGRRSPPPEPASSTCRPILWT